jgi:hypothetical protein
VTPIRLAAVVVSAAALVRRWRGWAALAAGSAARRPCAARTRVALLGRAGDGRLVGDRRVVRHRGVAAEATGGGVSGG